ncbi:MAG: DUF4402 domain-containing protein [Pseudomonadota bacterium]
MDTTEPISSLSETDCDAYGYLGRQIFQLPLGRNKHEAVMFVVVDEHAGLPMIIRAAIFFSLSLWCLAGKAMGEAAGSGANISIPLQLQNETPLYFGQFSAGRDAVGTLTLHEDGVTSDGVVTLFSNDQSAARFRVTGRAGALYNIEYPDEVVLTNSDQSELVAHLIPLAPRHLPDGEDVFFICAQMQVPARQQIDTYNGMFVVTVSYQ